MAFVAKKRIFYVLRYFAMYEKKYQINKNRQLC